METPRVAESALTEEDEEVEKQEEGEEEGEEGDERRRRRRSLGLHRSGHLSKCI